jgi:tetratricopeptide (TPR) repeat protein
LRFDLRPALFPLGQHERIEECLREAEAMAEALGDKRRLGQALAFLAQHYLTQGNYGEGMALGDRALAISVALADARLEVSTSIFLARAAYALGEYRRAITLAQGAVARLNGSKLAYDRVGLVAFPAITLRMVLIVSLFEQGKPAESLAHAEEALRIASRLDHPLSLGTAYYYVGYSRLVQADLDPAITALERAAEIGQANAIGYLFPVVAADLGYAYALCGRMPEALRMLEHAAAQIERTVQGFSRMRALVSLGGGYLVSGQHQVAHEIAQRALALAQTCHERGNQAWMSALLAEIAACAEPPEVERAEGYYRQALALAEELGMRPLAAHCHLGLGTLYQKTGRHEQARAKLDTAAWMYRAMEMPFWLEKAEAVRAEAGT